MSETIIETRTCRACQSPYSITDRDMEFYAKVSPTFSGKKEVIPPPTLCPECRQKRRLAWRNRSFLYHGQCVLTEKPLITMYPPDSPVRPCDTRIWESDQFDALTYGRAYDESQSFFEQFTELMSDMPMAHVAVMAYSMENAEFTNGANDLKNAYLCFGVNFCENIYYCNNLSRCYDCIDCAFSIDCKICYECSQSSDLYCCLYCHGCNTCHDCKFCIGCQGCSDCFGCTNLTQAQYAIFNEKFSSRQTYEAHLHTYTSWSVQEIREHLKQLSLSYPHPYANIFQSEECSGDYIVHSKNCIGCFDVKDSENLKNCFFLRNSTNTQDVSSFGDGAEYCYETMSTGLSSSHVCFCTDCFDAIHDVFYCRACYPNVSNCFGCIGLRNKQYCILNKQYSPEEYEKIIPKIIENMRTLGEWGEFPPARISPFAYNQSDGILLFPMDRKDALKQGFHWSDYESPLPKVEKTIQAHLLMDDISKIPDDILNWAIVCEATGKPFRIIKPELEFYRKFNISIPKYHPNQRYKHRLALRNPQKLFSRICDRCQTDIQTTYAPDRPETVYCEACYTKEIYG